jgi:carbonic anhydrase
VGSVEYGAVKWGARLVVVLGHTDCGAVATTVGELLNPVGALSENVRTIFDFVRPVVEPLMGVGMTSGREAVERRGVRENVSNSARILRSSPVLAGLAEREGLMVVGALYSLETGEVEFFDGVAS